MYTKILKEAKYYRYNAIIDMIVNLFDELIPLFIIFAFFELVNNNVYIFSAISAAILILILLRFVIRKNSIMIWSQNAISNLSNKYIKALYSNSRWGIKEKDIVEFISSDINSIRKLSVFYEEIIPQFFSMLFLYILLVIISILNNNFLFIIVPICLFIMYLLKDFIKNIQDKVNKRRDRRYLNMGEKFIEDLKGMSTILMYQAQEKFQKNFNEKSEKHRSDIIFALGLSLPRSSGRIIIANLGIVIFAYLLNNNEFDLGLNRELIIMGFLNISILVKTKKFAYANKQVSMLKPVLIRVFETVERNQKDFSEIGDYIFDKKIEEICIRDASFKYDQQRDLLLNNVSITFKSGNFYSIVGENGSGKSSLIKLIQKRFELLSGEITIDSIPLSMINNESLSSSIAIIENKSFVFSTSIRENLELASNGKYLFTEIIDILKSYGLMSYVESLEKKWDSHIGENGRRLSQGQRQQLTIAMMILQDKSVYILDEATASVNPENTEIILDVLEKLAKDKIVINITHRITDILRADTIIFIDKGKVYQGKNSDLQKIESYNALYDKIKGGN